MKYKPINNPIYKYYPKLFKLLFLTVLTVKIAYGQTTNTDSLLIADTTDYSDVRFNFYMFDFNFTNNQIKTKGSNPDITIPAFINDFTFLHKSGLQTGLMLTNYSDADTLSYDMDLSFGYQRSFFNDLFDIDANYIYHNYKGEEAYEGISYKHALNLSLGLTYKMIYLYADGNFLIDNKNYFTSIGLTTTVDFENILFKNDFLFIMPTTSANYGTDYYLYDIYEPYINNYLIPYLRYKGYNTWNLTSEELIERYLINQGVSTNSFSYQGLDLLIPVTYGKGSVSVSFSWMYYMPSDKLKIFGMKDQSGYIISLSFIF